MIFAEAGETPIRLHAARQSIAGGGCLEASPTAQLILLDSRPTSADALAAIHPKEKIAPRVIVQGWGDVHPDANMHRDIESRAQTESYPTREGVLRYLVDRGVITPGTQEWEVVRTIAASPPPLLSVRGAACALSLGIHTLIRIICRAGLPSPAKWVVLARALRAQRAILSGATIHETAIAAGYCHQTGLSSVLQRTTGFRASKLRVITWQHLVDIWIANQRRRGALVTPPARGSIRLNRKHPAAAPPAREEARRR